MNRDERQQLRLITEEVSAWAQTATAVGGQRRAVANASVAARDALRSRVVDVGQDGEVAWRVLPLRPSDSALLQDLARYDELPKISDDFRTALKRLTTEAAAALHDVRALTGVGRFFRGNTARDKGYQASQFLTQFRDYFLSHAMPDTLARLAATPVA
jgi:hypothetical protein